MVKEQILTLEHFVPVPNSTYKTNIPNLETIAYRFEVPNGLVYKLDNSKRFLMRLTAYEEFTGINTDIDFAVQASHRVAQVYKNGQVQYNQMAVARGRTSGKISHAISYDPSTNEIMFSALNSGITETVDVFYLIAEGQMRFHLASPSRVVKSSKQIFQSSLSGLNMKNQFDIKDSLFFTGSFEGRAGFKFEFSINSPAEIILRPEDVSSSIGRGWNDVALLEIPVIIAGDTEIEMATGKNVVEETNKQMEI